MILAARAVLAGRTSVEGTAGPLASGPSENPVAALPDREFEVVLLIGHGYAPRRIANAPCLSVSTIEAYHERI